MIGHALKPRDDAEEEAARRFAVRLSPTVLENIRHDRDPVALQYLPDGRELEIAPDELADPIGDHTYSPVRGIVHRHPDRVLLKVSSVCAVNCRFCFRKTMLGTPEETLNEQDMQAALDYIAATPAIWEVILTGGDPLVLSPRRLGAVLDRLEAIDHVKIIRIHSRVPVADPARLTPALCKALERDKPLYMVLHVNHAQELATPVINALKKLNKIGIALLSQSVLLKDVNDSAAALETLFRRLAELRVKPYYLHHPDKVQGTGHFRVSIAEGQALMRTLRARVSGLALPTYVLDIPGGYGKIPLESAYIEEKNGVTSVIDHQGRTHLYA